MGRLELIAVDYPPAPARTLLDNAEVEAPQRLRTLVEAAIREELLSQAELDCILARSLGRRGVPKLTAALRMITDEPSSLPFRRCSA